MKKILARLEVPTNIAWSYQDPTLMTRAINDITKEMLPSYPDWNTGIVRSALMQLLTDGKRAYEYKVNGCASRTKLTKPRKKARRPKYFGQIRESPVIESDDDARSGERVLDNPEAIANRRVPTTAKQLRYKQAATQTDTDPDRLTIEQDPVYRHAVDKAMISSVGNERDQDSRPSQPAAGTGVVTREGSMITDIVPLEMKSAATMVPPPRKIGNAKRKPRPTGMESTPKVLETSTTGNTASSPADSSKSTRKTTDDTNSSIEIQPDTSLSNTKTSPHVPIIINDEQIIRDRVAMPPPPFKVDCKRTIARGTSGESEVGQLVDDATCRSTPAWVYKPPPPRIACLKVMFVQGRRDFTPVAEFMCTLAKRHTLRRFFLTIEVHLEDVLDLKNTFLVYLSTGSMTDDGVRTPPKWRVLSDIRSIVLVFVEERHSAEGVYMTDVSRVSFTSIPIIWLLVMV